MKFCCQRVFLICSSKETYIKKAYVILREQAWDWAAVCIVVETIQIVFSCGENKKSLFYPWLTLLFLKLLDSYLKLSLSDFCSPALYNDFSPTLSPTPSSSHRHTAPLAPPTSPSEDKLWLGPDIPSNLLSQHRVKRARVQQRKPLYATAAVPEETWHTTAQGCHAGNHSKKE